MIPPNKTAWENRLGGKEAAQLIQARLAGWPERLLVTRKLPADDRAFLSGWRATIGGGLAALSDWEYAPARHAQRLRVV